MLHSDIDAFSIAVSRRAQGQIDPCSHLLNIVRSPVLDSFHPGYQPAEGEFDRAFDSRWYAWKDGRDECCCGYGADCDCKHLERWRVLLPGSQTCREAVPHRATFIRKAISPCASGGRAARYVPEWTTGPRPRARSRASQSRHGLTTARSYVHTRLYKHEDINVRIANR